MALIKQKFVYVKPKSTDAEEKKAEDKKKNVYIPSIQERLEEAAEEKTEELDEWIDDWMRDSLSLIHI